MAVHLAPAQAEPADLRGSIVVMVDTLRASTTIAAALHAGATEIIPCLSVEQAMHAAAARAPRPALGGERGGRLIPGFELGNSPRDYTPQRVRGRAVVFTTTNGTAALLHAAAAGAAEILIGAFANISAVCGRIAADPRPVHILCAATRDRVTLDDCLAAGAMVDRLLSAGRNLSAGDGGDPARLCLSAWHLGEVDLLAALAASRGGRNLAAIGLQRDIADCAAIDAHPVVPSFSPTTGLITC